MNGVKRYVAQITLTEDEVQLLIPMFENACNVAYQVAFPEAAARLEPILRRLVTARDGFVEVREAAAKAAKIEESCP